MSEEFVNSFAEFVNKIPSVRGGEILSLTFSIIHEKEKPGQRNVLVANYKTPKAQIEIFVQSPKEIALEGVDEKKLRSMDIGGKKFYTNYNPNLDDFIVIKGDFYTTVNDEVLTVLSPDKNILKSVESDKPAKFQKDLLSYAKKFVKDIDGFDLCMINWNKEDIRVVSRMIFFNVENQTEIIVDVFKGDKEATEILWEDIKGKKKLDGTLYMGKRDKEHVVCSTLDDNRVLVAKCTKGKDEFLPKVTRKVVKAIR
ncbi:MAG: hypothetical protein KAW40_01560 [Candidatus Aenigmarchaeota archaeon]|nr:hypothetical protein [Candidatus Aenigmarchaeota archaeon]